MAVRVIEVEAELSLDSKVVNAYIENPIALGPMRIHDYNLLYNKPILNGKTLEGEMPLSDVGLLFASYEETMEVLGGKGEEVTDMSEALTGVRFITFEDYESIKYEETSILDTIYYIIDYKTDSDGTKYGALCVGDGIKLIGDLPLTIGETQDENELINKVLDKVGVKVDESDPEMLVFYK